MDETRAVVGQLGELVGLDEGGNWKFNEPNESLPWRDIGKFARCILCRQPRVCHTENRALECPTAAHIKRVGCTGQKWMIENGFKK